MTIKIEFPSDNKAIAAAMGKALLEIAGESADTMPVYTAPGVKTEEKVADVIAKGKQMIKEVEASRDQLAADGAALIEDVPPPVAEETTEDVPPPPVAEETTEGSETDVNGLPWDKRIHSKNKSKNADGSWRNKRKTKEFETDEEWKDHITAVETELKGAVVTDEQLDQQTQQDEASVFDAAITADVPPPPAVEAPVADVPPPPAVEAPVADVPPPPPVTEVTVDTSIGFPQLMKLITSRQKDGAVDMVNEILTDKGIIATSGSALPLLKDNHPDQIPEVFALLTEKLEG